MRGSYTWCALIAAIVSVRSAPGQSCPSDANGNRVVDAEDLAIVLAQWGACDPSATCSGDVDGDGHVSGPDLAVVIAAWGGCPVTVPTWATLLEERPDPAVVHDPSVRASIMATGYAWRVRDTATQIEMVLIPGGTFQRGCSPSTLFSCTYWESPVHTVTLTQPYYMGRYEVTQSQWTATTGGNLAYFQTASVHVPPTQIANRPIEKVSWEEVQGFLATTGMRLPTEAEWEHAYRAETTTAFHSMPGHPAGTDDDSLVGNIARFVGNSSSQTRPVGQLAGNGYGLHDMSGNVAEWVSDRKGPYSAQSQTDPTGPSSGSRLCRGGSWLSGWGELRSSDRNGLVTYLPGYSASNIGFRVARTP